MVSIYILKDDCLSDELPELRESWKKDWTEPVSVKWRKEISRSIT
jgi:hypothetical protein